MKTQKGGGRGEKEGGSGEGGQQISVTITVLNHMPTRKSISVLQSSVKDSKQMHVPRQCYLGENELVEMTVSS